MIDRIKRFFSYSRTILAARIYSLLGALVALQGFLIPVLMQQDWTPVYTYVFRHVPTALQPLLIGVAIGLTGELFVYLRKKTDESLHEKVDQGEARDERREERR